MKIKHKFVEFIPEELEEGIIYISIEYATGSHKCICGCGRDVVTPVSPTDWELIYNGKTISLYPSIGNWSFECKSHYWIVKNEIIQARKWENWEIQEGRENEFREKNKYYDEL